ncbi:MAG: hypothetical protein KGS72_17820 [Cyanobacteria bacterium REEB67]|nr:hypothetical protein [Cyanobacteria bacterium REEB67]
MAAKRAYDIVAAAAFLNATAARLQATDWFIEQSWLISVHHFPAPPAEPESATLQIFKAHWYNDDHQGIHFETFLSGAEWRAQEMPVMMHILHTDCVPGTAIKRIKLSQPFIDKTEAMIATWPSYVFRTGKYGTHPFTRKIKINTDNSARGSSEIAAELARMCKNLGPIMDETLAELLATT